MAELTQKERLQPSLLDRLTDDDPTSGEGRATSACSRRCTSASACGATWLALEHVHLASLMISSATPRSRSSVINFGMPDLAGHVARSVDVPAAGAAAVDQAIWDFEPRLHQQLGQGERWSTTKI